MPTVALASSAGSLAVLPSTLQLAATAADRDGSVRRVEFYRGNSKIGQDTSAPYSFSVPITSAGTYTYSARAIDDDGGIGASTEVTITAGSPAPTPTPTPAPTPTPTTPPPVVTVGSGWTTQNLANTSGTFTVRFTITPTAANTAGEIGLAAGTPTDTGSLATILRMSGGAFQAINGTAYAANSAVRFDAGRSYDVRLVVNSSLKTYSLYIAKATTGQEVAVAVNYKFQPGAPTTGLNVLASRATTGTFTQSATQKIP